MEIAMEERGPMTILRQCCDMLCDDLEGQPLDIPRPGKEDMVLVSSETYSRLLDRIAALEAQLQTDAEREAEEEMLLRTMVDAANSGPLN
jgi:PHD/YefM family antitoxin component YafN of YafNO toxin-antitoxin module